MQLPQKRSRGNQVIHRRLIKEKSIGYEVLVNWFYLASEAEGYSGNSSSLPWRQLNKSSETADQIILQRFVKGLEAFHSTTTTTNAGLSSDRTQRWSADDGSRQVGGVDGHAQSYWLIGLRPDESDISG